MTTVATIFVIELNDRCNGYVDQFQDNKAMNTFVDQEFVNKKAKSIKVDVPKESEPQPYIITPQAEGPVTEDDRNYISDVWLQNNIFEVESNDDLAYDINLQYDGLLAEDYANHDSSLIQLGSSDSGLELVENKFLPSAIDSVIDIESEFTDNSILNILDADYDSTFEDNWEIESIGTGNVSMENEFLPSEIGPVFSEDDIMEDCIDNEYLDQCISLVRNVTFMDTILEEMSDTVVSEGNYNLLCEHNYSKCV